MSTTRPRSKRHWQVKRHWVEKPAASTRWDRAYQCLLNLTVSNAATERTSETSKVTMSEASSRLASPSAVNQEVTYHESSNLCPSINAAPSPVANH